MTSDYSDIRSALEDTDWDHVIVADGGRVDTLQEIAPNYGINPDTVQGVYNGGCSFTPDCFHLMFPHEYNAVFFHGGQPLHSMPQGEYDERDHFQTVPGYREYTWDHDVGTCPPETVAALVREYNPDRSVIRFVQPHAPFRDLPEITRGSGKIERTKTAIDDGALTISDLYAAYSDNYEWVLETIVGLAADLGGRVMLTADHGTCLYQGNCGQVHHARNFDPHDHLTMVPWVKL